MYRGWIAFGEILRRVSSTVILSAIFFLIMTPLSILLRISGKKLLPLNYTKSSDSYWLQNSGEGSSLEDQF